MVSRAPSTIRRDTAQHGTTRHGTALARSLATGLLLFLLLLLLRRHRHHLLLLLLLLVVVVLLRGPDLNLRTADTLCSSDRRRLPAPRQCGAARSTHEADTLSRRDSTRSCSVVLSVRYTRIPRTAVGRHIQAVARLRSRASTATTNGNICARLPAECQNSEPRARGFRAPRIGLRIGIGLKCDQSEESSPDLVPFIPIG